MGLVLQRKPPRQVIWDEHAAIPETIGKNNAAGAEHPARQHSENAAEELAAQADAEKAL